MRLLRLNSSTSQMSTFFANHNLLVLDNLVTGQYDIDLGIWVTFGNQSRLVQGFGHFTHGGQVNHSIAAMSSGVPNSNRTHVTNIVEIVQKGVLQREICKKKYEAKLVKNNK